MSRESAFSAMDSSDMNTALNDYFGGLARPVDPVDLMKENDERNEYNEKLLELTGAVGGPLIDQGLHGATHQLLKGVKYVIGRTGKSVLGQLGMTPEKFEEYAKKYGLSDQTLKDLSEGKINLTKLAKGGLDEAFEKLGKAKNVPSDLIRAGGPVLAEGKDAVNRGLAAAHKVAGAGDIELQDLSSQALKKGKKKLSKAERRARRLAKTQRDAVGEARGNLKGNLKERFADDRINLAGRARQANANAGKILDANVRTNAARSKLPLEITEQDAFSTGIDLPSDIKNKKDLSGKTRNDDLGSVDIPEDWSPGAAPNRSVETRRQLLREQRRRAKDLKDGKITAEEVKKAEAEQQKRILKRGDRLRGKTKPVADAAFDDPIKKSKSKDPGFSLGTDNPFDFRVYDSPEATAARDAINAQFAKSEEDSNRILALAKNESERPELAGLPNFPDLASVIAPKEELSESIKAQLPDIGGLPSLAGKSKLPVGPIEQGQEGFAKQQVKLLSAKLAAPAPTETNVAPTTKVATQAAPSEDLADNDVRVGGSVAGVAPGAILAAAAPDQTAGQRGVAAGEATGQDLGAAALQAATGVEEAGLLPGAVAAAAAGGGTVTQRVERAATAGAEQEAPKIGGALVRKATSLSTGAETEGGQVGSTAVNTATKSAEQAAAKAAAKAAGTETEDSLGEDLGKNAAKALATAGETEGELGGPEDPIADIVSLGLGLGTLFGGLGGVEHQKLPTYRTPVNPSVVYGI